MYWFHRAIRSLFVPTPDSPCRQRELIRQNVGIPLLESGVSQLFVYDVWETTSGRYLPIPWNWHQNRKKSENPLRPFLQIYIIILYYIYGIRIDPWEFFPNPPMWLRSLRHSAKSAARQPPTRQHRAHGDGLESRHERLGAFGAVPSDRRSMFEAGRAVGPVSAWSGLVGRCLRHNGGKPSKEILLTSSRDERWV